MDRHSGILLHISSLPSRHGIGTLGREAYVFADFLHAAGQKYSWPVQVLIRHIIDDETNITGKFKDDNSHDFNSIGQAQSVLYSFIVLGIVPILIIYPFIQKYFAKGVNLGGVKE